MKDLKQYILWLWDASQGIRPRIVISALIGILDVVASLLFVWLCKQLIDIATRTSEGNMTHYTIFLVITVVVQLLFSAWNNRLENANDILFKNKLRYNLFSHLMTSTWNGKERFHSGDAVNRLEEDVRLISEAICRALPSLGVTCIQIVAAFIFLSFLDGRLALAIILIMPVFLLISKVYIKRMRRLTKKIRSTDGEIQSHMQEKLQHKVLIQTLEQSKAVVGDLGIFQKELYKQTIDRINFTLFSRTLVMAGFITGYLVAFVWGVNGIYEGVVSFGVMTAFLQLVGQIQRPMVDLSRYIPSLVHAITSTERLKELSDLPLEKQGVQEYLGNRVGVSLNNVSFAYPDGERDIIKDFSFDFTPGSRTAIVGETGVGKSTLIRLMLSLLKAQSGNIYLYNIDRKTEASPLTRCNLVYVPQGNTLLSGTIRENLLLGNPIATAQQLKEALQTAAAEFVYDLPDGLDTYCGERGAGLSEGQAQRICIARGLLRSGSILLLDEFSSSLDTDTEQLLMERLTLQAKDKTLIFITHREMITTYCDKIIKLKKTI